MVISGNMGHADSVAFCIHETTWVNERWSAFGNERNMKHNPLVDLGWCTEGFPTPHFILHDMNILVLRLRIDKQRTGDCLTNGSKWYEYWLNYNELQYNMPCMPRPELMDFKEPDSAMPSIKASAPASILSTGESIFLPLTSNRM